MRLGVALPLGDIGGEAAVVREFAQAAEALGFHHLTATDHVLGANIANRPNWGDRNTSKDFFHDPFVLFGFLSGCTRKVELSTQVLVLAQRQTALVAKQAACADLLSGGRIRLGVGIGWNEVEFTALNENFHNRGKRSEEQVQVMQALWAEPHVTFRGKWHTIEDAGINPLPVNRSIPIWFGGHADVTLRRIAKWGDGWMMLAHPNDGSAQADFAKLRSYVKEEGRDPAEVGIEVWVSAGTGGPKEWRAELQAWKDVGVTHATLNNTYSRYHHKRIPGRTLGDHLDAAKRYWDAVADLVS